MQHTIGMVWEMIYVLYIHKSSLKWMTYSIKGINYSVMTWIKVFIKECKAGLWSDNMDTGRNSRQKIHTCSPNDRHRLTGSLRVNGVDANCVCLILLQAINHMRGGIALQRLLIDHPRSVSWDNKTEKCLDLISFIHIIIASYRLFFSIKLKSVSFSNVKANTWWLRTM